MGKDIHVKKAMRKAMKKAMRKAMTKGGDLHVTTAIQLAGNLSIIGRFPCRFSCVVLRLPEVK
jgi:hypothetical protein